jgi:hypothetical protein
MHLNHYVKAFAYFEAQHALAISLKLAHVQSNAEINMGVASPFTSEQLAMAQLLAQTKLMDCKVTRLHWRAWMIECVRRQSGSRLPSMVVTICKPAPGPPHLLCGPRGRDAGTVMISKSTSHVLYNMHII